MVGSPALGARKGERKKRMSLGDMFQPEKEVILKITVYEELVRKSERASILEKAIYTGLPRETIIQLIAGKPPELEEYEKTGMSPDEIRKICIQFEEARTSIGFHEEREKSLQTALDKLQADYEQLCKIVDDQQKELEEAEKKQKAAEKPAEKPKKTNGGGE